MTAFSKSICFCPILFCLYLPQLASGQTRKETSSRSLTVGIPANDEVIASDDFSSYIPGTDGLLGQAAGGTGFTGTWQSLGLQANLDVFANPSSVGSLGTSRNPNARNAGNALNFVSPVSIGNRQLFIRFRYVNLNTANIHESSRLDMNYASPGEGNRVILGSYVSDNLQLVLEPNLHTGLGHLIADSGIGTVSGTGSHVVVGLLDEQFGQIAIWVDPDTKDFYHPLTGANSADAVTAWGVPAGGLTNFVSYSLIRNFDDRVKFEDVVFARVMGATKTYADNSKKAAVSPVDTKGGRTAGARVEQAAKNAEVAKAKEEAEKHNQSQAIDVKKNNLSQTDPFLRTIRGATWFGTRSSEQYQKLLSMLIHGDNEAFSKALIGLISAGDAVMFKDGEEVFLRPSFSLLLIKVRRKGDTAEYWTDSSAF